MEDFRQTLLGTIDFLLTWKGLLLIFLACFVYKAWPFLRVAIADCIEAASLTIDTDTLRERFQVSTSRVTPEKRSETVAAYAELVRQENWPEVYRQIDADDAARAIAADGGRKARIGVLAAVQEIHAAVAYGGQQAVDRVKEVLDLFEDHLEQAPSSLARAVVTAEAHMEVGWLYRGSGTIDTVSGEAMANMQHHFERARSVLRPFRVAELGSPILCAANFRLAVGLCDDEILFHAARSIWMDVDPSDPEMMGQVAFHLLPRWYGSYRDLHRAAIDVSRRSGLGSEAYSMMILTVASEEPKLVEAIDAEKFVDGAFAILDRASDDQAKANEVAAGLFYLMLNASGARRRVLRAGLRQVLETKMRTFMIDIWPDTLSDIRVNLARLFGAELSAGATVHIDESGCRIEMV